MTDTAQQRGAEPIIIPLPDPFNYEAALAYLNRSSDEALYAVEGEALWKLFVLDGEDVLARIERVEGGSGADGAQEEARVKIGSGADRQADARSRADSGAYGAGARSRADSGAEGVQADAAGALLISFPRGDEPSAGMRIHIEAYVGEWFDLDRELAPFYLLTEGDNLLREAGRRFHGLRMIGMPDLFEALCWAIIGQQINLTFAYTLKKRFTETFGRSVEWNGRRYWAFPEPSVVAALEPAAIMELQMTGRKSEYLIGVAALVADGSLDKQSLLQAGWQGAESRLVSIRGIGLWTAHYVMMRCLRMPEALPAADVGLLNAIKAAGGMEVRPTAGEARELAKPWAGWEAYATFYLWRTLY